MSTTAIPYPTQRANTANLYSKEVKYEFLKLLRTRSFSLSVIGFPVMVYSTSASPIDGTTKMCHPERSAEC